MPGTGYVSAVGTCPSARPGRCGPARAACGTPRRRACSGGSGRARAGRPRRRSRTSVTSRPPAPARRDRVGGRRLPQPRRRDREHVDGVVEVERDPLVVLVQGDQLDPGAVPAGAVLQPHRSGERLARRPGVARDHRRREAARPSSRASRAPCSPGGRGCRGSRPRTPSPPPASALPTACRTCSASSARPCSIRSVGTSPPRARSSGPKYGPELRVVHEDADVAQRLGRVGQLRDEPLVGEVEPVVVGDLHDPPGPVAGRDDGVDVLERDAERLLAQHVQAGLERGEHRPGVGRVRRRRSRRRRARSTPIASSAVATRSGIPKRSPTRSRTDRLGSATTASSNRSRRSARCGQVHGLGDQPGADHPHPLAIAPGGHARKPRRVCMRGAAG